MHIGPFIPHIIIVTFVIEFSRNSHIGHFQSLPYLSPTPHYVFTLFIGFAQICGSSPGRLGATAPSLPPPRGDANGDDMTKL